MTITMTIDDDTRLIVMNLGKYNDDYPFIVIYRHLFSRLIMTIDDNDDTLYEYFKSIYIEEEV